MKNLRNKTISRKTNKKDLIPCWKCATSYKVKLFNNNGFLYIGQSPLSNCQLNDYAKMYLMIYIGDS